MKRAVGPTLGLAILFSLTAMAFRTVNQNERLLADRIAGLESRLSDDPATRGDVATLKHSLTAVEASLREQLEEAELRQRRAVEEAVLAARAPADRIDLVRDVMLPSIQVTARGGVGGGTIIHSTPDASGAFQTFAVTAFHVVSKSLFQDDDGRERRLPIDVKLYRIDGGFEETLQADLVIHDDTKDIALIKLRSERHHPAARLMTRERLREIGVFTPITAIGCPLGHDPLPSRGEITSLRKDVNGERFWMMNAPTIFGNSGGGVFHRETRELLGVSAMVCTYDNPASTPVPHLGILLSLESVYDWLAGNRHDALITPAADSLGAAPGAAVQTQASR